MHAKRISVSLSNKSNDDTPIFDTLKMSPIINFARKNFESLKIDELDINQYKVTFSYMDHPHSPTDNSLTLTSDEINASLSYRVYKDHMVLDLPYAIHKPSQIILNGKSLYDFKEEKGYSLFSLLLPDEAEVKLYTKENGKHFAFTASSNVLNSLEHVVGLFKLRESISKWIIQNNIADSYQLIEAKGIYSYTDPDLLLNTLFLHARETNLAYSFNESLSPIVSEETDVYFKKGILDIQPHKASYTHHQISKGRVTLDFNPKQIMLKVALNADIPLDQNVVDIVAAYNINLPLLQENGTTRSNLEIHINLENEKAYALGQFFVKKSDLILNGVSYRINNAAVRLHRNILNIDTVKLAYKEILETELNGQMDLKSLSGDFYYTVEKAWLPFGQKQLKLLNQNIQLQQHFGMDSQSYIVPQTHWELDDFNITVAANTLSLPEKFTSTMYLKDVKVTVKDLVDMKVSGNFDISREYANLDINTSRFNYLSKDMNITVEEPALPFLLVHENNVTHIHTLCENNVHVNRNHVKISPTSLSLQDGYLDVNDTEISIEGYLSSRISSHYELESQQIRLSAHNTRVISDNFLFLEPSFDLSYEKHDGKSFADVESYGLHAVITDKEGIRLTLDDFSKIHPYSKIMQLYDIKKGAATFTYIDDHVGMDITLKGFHPLSSKNGKDITRYDIKGDYADKTLNLQINKDLDLIYRKKGKLTAKNIDFNLFPILEYIDMIDTKDKDNNLELFVKTKKCGVKLGSSGRKLVSDTITMNIKKDEINAQLIHGRGGVMFESHDQNISVFGRGLDDTFMNGLFKFSTFQGGELSFVMQGPFDDMHGLMNIKNTVIKDYTVLNNTLAFFNTIPSLMTFSVPGYSQQGLRVDEMYASFHKIGPQMKIKDAKINSKELLITAEGETDFEKENIEMLMQVKTDLGSTAKDIPLIGYLIFGDDTVSTTVRVHGPLSDPKVESSVAKSIITAPYNIIKRTITLPFKVFDIFDDTNESKK